MTIEVVLLGTGNPIPDRDRAGAATLVRVGGRTLLFDAGRGVCMRLAAAGVLPVMLDAIYLTHLHSDHICDLNDVVTTQWVMSPAPKRLSIFGPPRTREVMNGLRAMLQPDVEYRLAHHPDLTWEPDLDVVEVAPGLIFEQDDLVRMVQMQRIVDTIDYHSTVVQAAQTAARGGVKTLVLTHQIPTPAPGAAGGWIAIAREHFTGEIV